MTTFTRLIGLALVLGATGVARGQQYMPTLEEFGKNRVQYKRFDWKVLTTTNFEVYFYADAQTAATLAAQYAEADFDRTTGVLGYTPYSRTKIFLYNSVSDLNQSNIGITLSSERDNQEEGLSKSRIEIAFPGNQVEFRRQLVREIASVFIYDMLYGGSLKDALQSSLLLTLPDWFMSGITAYIAEGWSANLDSYVRDAAWTKRLRKPSSLSGPEAQLVGHSIWNYIAERYGRDNISNILNLTRIIRNEQTSIASTLGVPYTRFLNEWRDYYANMANTVAEGYQPLPATSRLKSFPLFRETGVNRVKLSPDQKYVAYAMSEKGRFSVAVVDVQTGKRTELISRGHKVLNRHNFQNPLVAWVRGNAPALVFEERGKLWLYVYNGMGERGQGRVRVKRALNTFNQIDDFDISDDGSVAVLSADRKGQNDLFLYNVNRSVVQQLTNDLYDDLTPNFVGRSSSQVVFVSNRLRDTLNADRGTYKTIRDHLSLFVHEGSPRAVAVTRLADSLGRISQPIAADLGTVYFLSEAQGVRNVYRYDTLSKSAQPVTNFRSDLLTYDLNPTTGGLTYVANEAGEVHVGYIPRLDLSRESAVSYTPRVALMEGRALPQAKEKESAVKLDAPVGQPVEQKTNGIVLRPGEVDTDNYKFDIEAFKVTERRNERPNKTTSSLTTKTLRRDNIRIKGPVDYNDRFVINSNEGSFLVDPIRNFGYRHVLTMNDLLENNLVKAGIFITPNFRNSDIFAEYHYLPQRLDYSVRFDRRTILLERFNEDLQKYRYNKITATVAYPINEAMRVSLSPFYAITRLVQTGPNTVPNSDKTSDYAGARAEFVFDNTTTNGMNMLEGTRLKVKYQHYTGLRSSQESFDRFNVDARNYTKIHRDLILATRISYGRSGGNSPKFDLLGGMDNWLFFNREPRSAENPLNTSDIEDNRDLFFTDFVTPMRGFNYNKLAGTSHLVFNAELRLPLVRYLYRGPITSNFLRNFQLVGFTDVGTAWKGNQGPFSRQNSLNTESVGGNGNAFTATVTNFKNPYLIGYGAGVRTIFLGYYTKFDIAWGMEDRTVAAPILYLTLGYDF
ncbi:MAG: hypothetical protein LH606_21370 [Cytophagaceae bacterium]|nr:hypothetical protein [Cytophagaceae bacterium]